MGSSSSHSLRRKALGGGHPEVILKFAPVLQVVLLVHIILQVLGIGIHGPQLVYLDHLSSFAHPSELDKGPVGGIGDQRPVPSPVSSQRSRCPFTCFSSTISNPQE